jgi:hypothetical protein
MTKTQKKLDEAKYFLNQLRLDIYVLQAYVRRESERAPDRRPAIKRKCDEYIAFLEKIVSECHERFDNR